MKMNKRITVAMLALAAIGLASTGASAQTVSAGDTDLILGFQLNSTTGTGANVNLEIDLGSAALFTTTSTLSLNQLVAADLVSTYGANWATQGNLTWAVAGITSDDVNAFDATVSDPTKAKNATNLSLPYGTIQQMASALTGNAQLSNSSAAQVGSAANPASGIVGSFSNVENNGLGHSDFGYLNPSGVSEVNGNSGVTLGSDKLYAFQEKTGNAALLGTFNLSDDGGNLSFTYVGAQAVPEPSAYALGICAVLLFLVLKRRHSVA